MEIFVRDTQYDGWSWNQEAFGSFLTKQIAKFLAFLVKTSSIRPTLVKVVKWGEGFRIFEHSDWEKNKKML